MNKETKLILDSLIGFQAKTKTDQDAAIKIIAAYDQDHEFSFLIINLLTCF
jgi:hypothetical protein